MAADIGERMGKTIAKINEKNPYYLLGIVLLVIFLVFSLPIYYQLKTLSTISPKIAAEKQALESTKSNIRRLPQYRKELDELKTKMARLNRKMKSREQFPSILELISQVANRNKVKIEQIMPNTNVGDPILKNDDGEFYSIPVVMELHAGYHDFGRFLNQLENENFLFNISRFVIEDNANDQMHHEIRLTLQTIIFEKSKDKK